MGDDDDDYGLPMINDVLLYLVFLVCPPVGWFRSDQISLLRASKYLKNISESIAYYCACQDVG